MCIYKNSVYLVWELRTQMYLVRILLEPEVTRAH